MASSKGHWVRNMVFHLPKPDSFWLMALSNIFFTDSAFLSSHISRRVGLFISMYIHKWKGIGVPNQMYPKVHVVLCACNPCCIQDLSFNCWCVIWHFLTNNFFFIQDPIFFHKYFSLSYLLCKIIMLKPSLIPNMTELWIAETMVNCWNGGQIPTAFRAIPRDLLVLKDKENWTFK